MNVTDLRILVERAMPIGKELAYLEQKAARAVDTGVLNEKQDEACMNCLHLLYIIEKRIRQIIRLSSSSATESGTPAAWEIAELKRIGDVPSTARVTEAFQEAYLASLVRDLGEYMKKGEKCIQDLSRIDNFLVQHHPAPIPDDLRYIYNKLNGPSKKTERKGEEDIKERKLIPVTPVETPVRLVRVLEGRLCPAVWIDVGGSEKGFLVCLNYAWKVSYVKKAVSYLVGFYRKYSPMPVFEGGDVPVGKGGSPVSLKDFFAANIETVIEEYERESEGKDMLSDAQEDSGGMSPVLVSFLSKNSIPWPRFFHTESLSDTYKASTQGATNSIGQDVGRLSSYRFLRDGEEKKKLSEIAHSFFSSIKKKDSCGDNTNNSPSHNTTGDKEDGENIEDRRDRG